ncbi:MAG TPA: hypothetical protein VFQ38_02065 [Longimicrobiales bacterium]|nr:hypothetical protein [Longimicrobiales bacterium]
MPATAPAGTAPAACARELLYGNATILVVGSPPAPLDALGGWAEGRGYRVLAESDADAALGRAVAERPAVILLAALAGPLRFLTALRSRKETRGAIVATALGGATAGGARALRRLGAVTLPAEGADSAWRALVQRLEDGAAALTAGGIRTGLAADDEDGTDAGAPDSVETPAAD